MRPRGGMFERLLEDVCDHHDLSIHWTSFGTSHGLHINGDGWSLVLAGVASSEEAAERALSSLRDRGRLEGCDVCLGAGLVPSSDWPGQTARCGDCRGGDPVDFHPSDYAVRIAAARSLK